MTSDLRARNKCPHQVKGEWLSLDVSTATSYGPGRVLRPLKPLSAQSAGAVRVRVGGEELPPGGKTRPASVTTPGRGPWRVSFGVNDRLAVGFESSDSGPVVMLQASPNPAASPASLAAEFNPQLEAASAPARFSVSQDGRLVLTSSAQGPESWVVLAGTPPGVAGRPLAPTLGWPLRRRYQGAVVLPGWVLVQDPLVSAGADPTRKVILFNDRLDLFLPEAAIRAVFEVDYPTLVGACRRCAALSNEWDHRYDGAGEPILARDTELLLQEAEKIVITVLGSNVFHPWYGTDLEKLLGRKLTANSSYLESQVQQGVTKALNRLQSLKAQQARLQPVTDLEYLARVAGVDVRQDPADPVFLSVRITLQNRAGDVQTLTRSVATLAAVRPDLLAPRRLS
jgi:hypothetical protein